MLRFRPHHFMCTMSFKGLGYSPEFVENYWQVVEQVHADMDAPIMVTYTDDNICSKCPHLLSSGLCESQHKIEQIDQQHGEVLGLKQGKVLSWNEALIRIKQNMSLANFHRVCAKCQWKSLGICEAALVQLLDES